MGAYQDSSLNTLSPVLATKQCEGEHTTAFCHLSAIASVACCGARMVWLGAHFLEYWQDLHIGEPLWWRDHRNGQFPEEMG